jgi:hypothetical protein
MPLTGSVHADDGQETISVETTALARRAVPMRQRQ